MNDWQAYLDGSLTAADRERLDSLLSQDASARAELDGLSGFRAALRSTGQSVTVPSRRETDAMLREIVRSGSRGSAGRWRMAFVPVALLLVMVAAWLFYPRPAAVFEGRVTPVVAQAEIGDSLRAAEWLVETADRPAPNLNLTAIGAELTAVSTGEGWIGFNFEMDGETYTVYGRQGVPDMGAYESVIKGDMPYFLVRDGVAWPCRLDTVYVVFGGTAKGRWTIAEKACRTTPNLIGL